jgi:hypothetical protein
MHNDNISQNGPRFHGRLDQLPVTARKELSNPAFKWTAASVYGLRRCGRLGFQTGPDVAARVSEADEHQIVIAKLELAAEIAAVAHRAKGGAP